MQIKCDIISVVLLQLLCTTYVRHAIEMALVLEVSGEPEFTIPYIEKFSVCKYSWITCLCQKIQTINFLAISLHNNEVMCDDIGYIDAIRLDAYD